jgi:GT2 family glycosyltransferase
MIMSCPKIAILMACHNRKQKTLACLRAVFSQKADVNIQVILLDDGSTDGTGADVACEFPTVSIIKGNGNLYWNKGMHLAFETAMKEGYDYYMWLNDDTLLYTDALQNLTKEIQKLEMQIGKAVILVGSTIDPLTGTLSYGGSRRVSKWHPDRSKIIDPSPIESIPCDTFNGNCVLIADAAARITGNLDWRFAHAMGDNDYGLRAKKKGVAVFVAPGFIGKCSRNESRNTWLDASLPLLVRLKKKESRKGLPFMSQFIYCVRHAGLLGVFIAFLPYLNLLRTHVEYRLTKKNITRP